MSRPRGGFIGHNPAPAASAVNSAAGGIWTLREAEALKRAGTWPQVFSSPTQISGLQLWLDASDASTLYDATSGGSLVAADGGVARWEDKSGNNRHATQGTAGYRPARKTAIQGGKDVLRFDGSNDSVSVPSSTATFKFLHSSDSTVFVVMTRNASGGEAIISTHQGGSATRGYSLFSANGASTMDKLVAVISKGVANDNVTLNTSSNSFLPSGWSVLSVISKPTSGVASERSSMRRNGGTAAANNTLTSAVSTSNAYSDLIVGAFADFPSTITMNADFAELIIYDSALSDTDREAVENYLLAKWSIT